MLVYKTRLDKKKLGIQNLRTMQLRRVMDVDSQTKTSQISRPFDLPYIQTKDLKDEITSDSEERASYFGRDEWLLKFEVNENGVGQILLPPDLTIFLQSDRVCVMPMGGGLFIKSLK